MERVRRELARADREHAVRAGSGMQRRTIDAGRREVTRIGRVVADVRVIRRDVRRVRRNRYRLVEADRLPSGRGFAGELRAREQRAAGRPKVADVRAVVGRALIEAYARDEAVDLAREPDADFLRRRVAAVDGCRHRDVVIPEARAGAGARTDRYADRR